MKRIHTNSRIEIWQTNYINDVNQRSDEDKDVDIIQIETTNDSDNFIVEVKDKIAPITLKLKGENKCEQKLNLDVLKKKLEKY